MTGYVGKLAVKKLLGSEMSKYKHKETCGDDDPYFKEVTTRNGRTKKVKKEIPAFIPDHDAKVLASAKKRAYYLDMGMFNFLGIRFGYSSVIGLIPEIGDVIDLMFAWNVYKKCNAVDGGLPSSLQNKMVLNIIIDFVIGLVPIFGDLMDAYVKCNTKNVKILEEHLMDKHDPQKPPKESERQRKKRLRTLKKARLEAFEEDSPLSYSPDRSTQEAVVTKPEPVKTTQESRGGRSWFGGGGRRGREPDEEMAQPAR